AISKAFIASLLIYLLVLQLVAADMEISNKKNGYGSKIVSYVHYELTCAHILTYVSFILRLTFIFVDCGSACIARCRLSSRPNLCHRACGTCCARCNCVPPGTYGNYDKCKCYASLTTHDGRRKCP
ncbi:unnamed protein product, partial [Brassica oleracea]